MPLTPPFLVRPTPTEEAALYDRQLRLWGSVAQSRIRQCRVLLAPFQGGLAVETAKNLILAGVKELILLDDGQVDGYSLAAGFVWREEDIGKNVSGCGSCSFGLHICRPAASLC